MNVIQSEAEKEKHLLFPKYDNIDSILLSFKNADVQLMLAIEEDKSEEIETASTEIDTILEYIFAYECKNQSEKLELCRFLLNRFLLPNSADGSLGKRASDKVLTCIGKD